MLMGVIMLMPLMILFPFLLTLFYNYYGHYIGHSPYMADSK
jgi:hypothetical protein